MRAISLAAVVFWTTVALAGGARAEADPAAISFKLGNGLRVVLAPYGVDSRALVLVLHGAGSGDDPRGFRGLAHVTEHMEVRFGRSVARLEGWGATDWNAVTTPDETFYYEIVPVRAVQSVLWQEAYRVAFAASDMTKDALAREREIVKHELRERTSGVAAAERADLVAAQLYEPDHPYRHALDSPADIDAITLSHVQWFAQAHYGPEQTTLVVLSALPHALLQSWIVSYFDVLRSAGTPATRAEVAPVQPLAGRTWIQIDDYARHEAVTLTWRVPGRMSPEHQTLSLATELLSHALNAVLVEEEGVASYTHTSLQDRAHDSLIEVTAVARGEETAAELIRRIDRELSFLLEGLSASPELARARKRVRRQLAFDADQPVARALALARDEEPTSTAQIDQLTSVEIGRVAKTWLSPRRRVASTVSTKPGRYGRASVKVRFEP